MDEATIVADNLAKVTPTYQTTTNSAENNNSGVVSAADAVGFLKLKDIFRVSIDSPRSKEVLQQIWDWARKNTESRDSDSVMATVISLKNRLGNPTMGEIPWARVLNYVNIWGRKEELEKTLTQLDGQTGS